MRKKFLLREIAGEFMLVPLGDSSAQFNSMVTLNETGAFIWKCLEKDMSVKEIAEKITQEYDVPFENAESDINGFVAYLKEKKII